MAADEHGHHLRVLEQRIASEPATLERRRKRPRALLGVAQDGLAHAEPALRERRALRQETPKFLGTRLVQQGDAARVPALVGSFARAVSPDGRLGECVSMRIQQELDHVAVAELAGNDERREPSLHRPIHDRFGLAEQPHAFGLALLAGDPEGRGAAFGGRIDGGTRAEQQLCTRMQTCFACGPERGDSVFSRLVDGGACLTQQPRALDLALLAGHEERRAPIVVRPINRGARRDEHTRTLRPPLLAGHEERCSSIIFWQVERRVRLTEERRAFGLALLARDAERRGPALVRLVDECLCCEQ